MDNRNETEFLRNKTILITGVTGFVAKILVEKILRVQPNVKKLYLLIRVKDTMTAFDRLHNEIMKKDLFTVLREEHGAKFDDFISEKVHPVAGDTSLPDLGLNNSSISKEIDAIIHVAATTRFDERYDLALSTNTLGARNVINFAKICSQLQILIHVSTAYVCGERKGLVLEEPCKIGETLNENIGLDIDAEKRLNDKTLDNLKSKGASVKEIRNTMRLLGQERARFYGWPNTYVFTKAMGEMLIWENKRDLPIVILRPTMISSTYKEPFPGWIEGFGSVSTVSIVYGKGFVTFTNADGDSVFDIIPADMVVNSIIVAMVANANRHCLTIYQVGSSLKNPINFRKLLDINNRYFYKNPWIDSKGVVVKIKGGELVKSRVIFLMHLVMPLFLLMVLKLVNIASGCYFKVSEDKLERRVKATVKVADIFRPYVFFAGIFDDENTERLRASMSQNGIDEEGSFNFDPRAIDWEEYLFNVHIPATVRYLF